MWYRSKTQAILVGLKLIDRQCDPEQLERKARELGIKLPVTGMHVSAPSMGGHGFGWQVPVDSLGEFRDAVDRILAGGSKRAA